jgi:hypothetical protein
MGWDEFEAEFARGTGLFLGGKRAKMMGVVFEHEEDPSFANFFRGSRRNHYLLVSGEASYCLRLGVFGVRVNWIVDHRDLVTEAWHRRGTVRGYVLDEMVLQHRGGTESFRVGGGESFRVGGGESFRVGGTDSFRVGGDSFRVGGGGSFRVGGTESFRVGSGDPRGIPHVWFPGADGDPRGPAGTHRQIAWHHRLRALTTAIERSGGNPAVYRHALDIDVT